MVSGPVEPPLQFQHPTGLTDDLNRLTGVTYPDGRLVNYSYDAVGNRTGMSSTIGAQNANTSYVYNGFNQLTSLTGPEGTTTFRYDGRGNEIEKQGPGVTSWFSFDSADRLRTLSTTAGVTDNYGYDAHGLRVQISDSVGDRRILLTAPRRRQNIWLEAGAEQHVTIMIHRESTD